MEEKKIFKIEQVDEDSYKVISLVNGNELLFKKNVALARKIQSVNANARLKMIKWMKEEGITKNDLIDKTERNGKVTYDESNYRDIERGFIEDEAIEIASNIYNTLFNMSLEEILLHLGFTNESGTEAYRFGNELKEIINSKKTTFPSK